MNFSFDFLQKITNYLSNTRKSVSYDQSKHLEVGLKSNLVFLDSQSRCLESGWTSRLFPVIDIYIVILPKLFVT